MTRTTITCVVAIAVVSCSEAHKHRYAGRKAVDLVKAYATGARVASFRAAEVAAFARKVYLAKVETAKAKGLSHLPEYAAAQQHIQAAMKAAEAAEHARDRAKEEYLSAVHDFGESLLDAGDDPDKLKAAAGRAQAAATRAKAEVDRAKQFAATAKASADMAVEVLKTVGG